MSPCRWRRANVLSVFVVVLSIALQSKGETGSLYRRQQQCQIPGPGPRIWAIGSSLAPSPRSRSRHSCANLHMANKAQSKASLTHPSTRRRAQRHRGQPYQTPNEKRETSQIARIRAQGGATGIVRCGRREKGSTTVIRMPAATVSWLSLAGRIIDLQW